MIKKQFASALLALVALAVLYSTSLNKEELKMSRNNRTVFQWFSCFNEKTQAECEDLKEEVEKQVCNTAAYSIGQLTYDGSPLIMKQCQQFHNFLQTAKVTDKLNTENYYEDCYLSSQVLKQAYQSAYYNNTIYYPLYIICAGF